MGQNGHNMHLHQANHFYLEFLCSEWPTTHCIFATVHGNRYANSILSISTDLQTWVELKSSAVYCKFIQEIKRIQRVNLKPEKVDLSPGRAEERRGQDRGSRGAGREGTFGCMYKWTR